MSEDYKPNKRKIEDLKKEFPNDPNAIENFCNGLKENIQEFNNEIKSFENETKNIKEDIIKLAEIQLNINKNKLLIIDHLKELKDLGCAKTKDVNKYIYNYCYHVGSKDEPDVFQKINAKEQRKELTQEEIQKVEKLRKRKLKQATKRYIICNDTEL